MQSVTTSITRYASKSAGCLVLLTAICFYQTDPGLWPALPGREVIIQRWTPRSRPLFQTGLATFQEVDSVTGTIAGETGKGLGPTFNGNSCAMCHAQPATGGSSPGLTSPQHPIANPQIALATLDGALNTVPTFITSNGPVREARFIMVSTSTGALDGGVHGLYTIQGRSGCTWMHPGPTEFRSPVDHPQRHLSHSHSRLRSGFSGEYS